MNVLWEKINLESKKEQFCDPLLFEFIQQIKKSHGWSRNFWCPSGAPEFIPGF
jgi:DNA-binding MltR family transcriptional regulator